MYENVTFVHLHFHCIHPKTSDKSPASYHLRYPEHLKIFLLKNSEVWKNVFQNQSCNIIQIFVLLKKIYFSSGGGWGVSGKFRPTSFAASAVDRSPFWYSLSNTCEKRASMSLLSTLILRTFTSNYFSKKNKHKMWFECCNSSSTASIILQQQLCRATTCIIISI